MKSNGGVKKAATFISAGIGKLKLKGFESQEVAEVYLSQTKEGKDQVTIVHSRGGKSVVPKMVNVDFCSVDEFLKWQKK